MTWREYGQKTKEKPHSDSLAEAVKLVVVKDSALDLGAGGLRDSKFLLQQGFNKVTAVDTEPATGETGKEINDDRLEIVLVPFQEFDFPEDSFDLVNAQFSLPFTPPESFNEVFGKMKNSLKEGGIFVGQLFGNNDEWKDNPERTFHTREQVHDLLSEMEILELKEEEREGMTVAGNKKHWHIFHIIARKR